MPNPQDNPVPFVQPGDLLPEFLRSFWQRQIDTVEQENPDFRHPPLPLARIKKVMKSDPDVKMIAADAPILFCKACEIFIEEITARAFIVADSNKRRTLSRSDIAKALSKSDQFDFLIDIVPRELGMPSLPSHGPGGSGEGKRAPAVHASAGPGSSGAGGVVKHGEELDPTLEDPSHRNLQNASSVSGGVVLDNSFMPQSMDRHQ